MIYKWNKNNRASLHIILAIGLLLTQLTVCVTAYASPVTSGASGEHTDTADVAWPSGPSVNAEAAIVMELSTGIILYEKNATEANYPASITKVMTALLAVENCSMNEIVSFSDTAVYGNGSNSSSIGMNVGESLTMENCMYGMMLASANEVAKAIGEHISGSLEDFVALMNRRAAELGCVNTHFANPNGLHDPDHYTCAYDMALIGRAAIKNPTFRTVAGTRVYIIPPTDLVEEDRWVANTHQMINPSKLPQYAYPDCYAGKTGFTNEARYTLVTFAKRGNLDVVCVTMHSQHQKDQYEDSITLLDYVFDQFTVHPISMLNNAPSFDNFSLFTRFSPLFDMKNAPLSIDTESFVVLPNGASFANVTQTITYHNPDVIEKGKNIIGQVTYEYGNKTVGYTDILYESSEQFLPVGEPGKEEASGQTEPSDLNPTDTTSTSETNPEESAVSEEGHVSVPGLKALIIGGIILFLVILGVIYYILVQVPYQRKRRAYYEKRRRHREQDLFQ